MLSKLRKKSDPSNRDQIQSRVFKLPAELRSQIYQLAFPNRTLHITCRDRRIFNKYGELANEKGKDSKLIKVPCLYKHGFLDVDIDCGTEADAQWGGNHYCCRLRFEEYFIAHQRKLLLLKRSKRAAFVNMMLTCHRLHDEILYHVYANTHFILNGFDLEAPYCFLSAISPKALNCITTMTIVWPSQYPLYLRGNDTRWEHSDMILGPEAEERKWEIIWKFLSSCTNLQKLCLRIFDQGFIPPEDVLLEPLKQVHAETFIVQIPWPWGYQSFWIREPDDTYHGVLGDDTNFRIIRPDDDNCLPVYARVNGYGRRRRRKGWREQAFIFCIVVTVGPIFWLYERYVS